MPRSSDGLSKDRIRAEQDTIMGTHSDGCRWPEELLDQIVEQRLCVDEVAGGETIGEPGVERGEEGAGGVALALALPEPRQAGSGAQLERLGLLPPGDSEDPDIFAATGTKPASGDAG
jgi:hypothetical protein